jgi:rhodanese-related sulfurtransferase
MKRLLVAFAALLLLPLVARAQIDAPRITQPEFKKLVAAKNVVVVDTRIADVFELGHIPGALLLPLEGRMTWPDEYEKTVAQLVKTKRPVVVYCA